MSNKGQTTTLAERVTIAERVRAGRSNREITADDVITLPASRERSLLSEHWLLDRHM